MPQEIARNNYNHNNVNGQLPTPVFAAFFALAPGAQREPHRQEERYASAKRRRLADDVRQSSIRESVMPRRLNFG